MADIGFYHLLTTPLERALPRLLERASGQGHRIVIRAASPERVEHLNALLWTYDDASFLPHGSGRDGNPAAQPIWLSDGAENPNGATILFLVDGVEAEEMAEFARCIDMFDGNDEADRYNPRLPESEYSTWPWNARCRSSSPMRPAAT